MNSIILQLNEVLSNIGFGPLLAIVILTGLYFYWLLSRKVGKDVNSIFDLWFVGFFAMFIWGRVAYIIAFWSQFESLMWFYLPYEKFADKVYLFRLLPWKLFAVWDGGILFSGMIVAFLLFSFIYIVFLKKWRWREMLKPVMVSTNIMLGLLFLVYGILVVKSEIAICGVILMLSVIVFIFDKAKNPLIGAIYCVLSTLFVGYIFMLQDVTTIDQINVIAIVVVGVMMALWYFRSFIVKDTGKTVVDYDIVENAQVQTNKAIKITKK